MNKTYLMEFKADQMYIYSLKASGCKGDYSDTTNDV